MSTLHKNTGFRWHVLAMAMLLVLAIVGGSTIARADVRRSVPSAVPDAVTDWNAIAVQAFVTAAPPRPGPVPHLDMAIVQAAVHDAVQAIDRRFAPYHVTIAGATGSPEAATAKAAHDVLVSILPSQAVALDTIYHNYMAANGLSETDPGVAVGAQAAAGILALRANDGRVPAVLPPPFTGGTAPGQWRPTPSYQPGPPPSYAPMATPWLGTVPPFALKSGDQFRAKAPPALGSKQYAEDYDEVKALGGLTSSRTPEQEQLAQFYATNLFVLPYRTLREVAAAHTHNIGDRARLHALASLAIADAVITVWDSKRHYAFWRPVTAIPEGDNDGNPQTVADPNWRPLLNTPPYPEYTSGANVVIGALTRTLHLYFETDHLTFVVHSQNAAAVPNTRTYTRFSALAQDMVDVRIYQGLHFRNADEEGRKQGRLVAQWVFGHILKPMN